MSFWRKAKEFVGKATDKATETYDRTLGMDRRYENLSAREQEQIERGHDLDRAMENLQHEDETAQIETLRRSLSGTPATAAPRAAGNTQPNHPVEKKGFFSKAGSWIKNSLVKGAVNIVAAPVAVVKDYAVSIWRSVKNMKQVIDDRALYSNDPERIKHYLLSGGFLDMMHPGDAGTVDKIRDQLATDSSGEFARLLASRIIEARRYAVDKSIKKKEHAATEAVVGREKITDPYVNPLDKEGTKSVTGQVKGRLKNFSILKLAKDPLNQLAELTRLFSGSFTAKGFNQTDLKKIYRSKDFMEAVGAAVGEFDAYGELQTQFDRKEREAVGAEAKAAVRAEKEKLKASIIPQSDDAETGSFISDLLVRNTTVGIVPRYLESRWPTLAAGLFGITGGAIFARTAVKAGMQETRLVNVKKNITDHRVLESLSACPELGITSVDQLAATLQSRDQLKVLIEKLSLYVEHAQPTQLQSAFTALQGIQSMASEGVLDTEVNFFGGSSNALEVRMLLQRVRNVKSRADSAGNKLDGIAGGNDLGRVLAEKRGMFDQLRRQTGAGSDTMQAFANIASGTRDAFKKRGLNIILDALDQYSFNQTIGAETAINAHVHGFVSEQFGSAGSYYDFAVAATHAFEDKFVRSPLWAMQAIQEKTGLRSQDDVPHYERGRDGDIDKSFQQMFDFLPAVIRDKMFAQLASMNFVSPPAALAADSAPVSIPRAMAGARPADVPRSVNSENLGSAPNTMSGTPESRTNTADGTRPTPSPFVTGTAEYTGEKSATNPSAKPGSFKDPDARSPKLASTPLPGSTPDMSGGRTLGSTPPLGSTPDMSGGRTLGSTPPLGSTPDMSGGRTLGSTPPLGSTPDMSGGRTLGSTPPLGSTPDMSGGRTLGSTPTVIKDVLVAKTADGRQIELSRGDVAARGKLDRSFNKSCGDNLAESMHRAGISYKEAWSILAEHGYYASDNNPVTIHGKSVVPNRLPFDNLQDGAEWMLVKGPDGKKHLHIAGVLEEYVIFYKYNECGEKITTRIPRSELPLSGDTFLEAGTHLDVSGQALGSTPPLGSTPDMSGGRTLGSTPPLGSTPDMSGGRTLGSTPPLGSTPDMSGGRTLGSTPTAPSTLPVAPTASVARAEEKAPVRPIVPKDTEVTPVAARIVVKSTGETVADRPASVVEPSTAASRVIRDITCITDDASERVKLGDIDRATYHNWIKENRDTFRTELVAEGMSKHDAERFLDTLGRFKGSKDGTVSFLIGLNANDHSDRAGHERENITDGVKHPNGLFRKLLGLRARHTVELTERLSSEEEGKKVGIDGQSDAWKGISSENNIATDLQELANRDMLLAALNHFQWVGVGRIARDSSDKSSVTSHSLDASEIQHLTPIQIRHIQAGITSIIEARGTILNDEFIKSLMGQGERGDDLVASEAIDVDGLAESLSDTFGVPIGGAKAVEIKSALRDMELVRDSRLAVGVGASTDRNFENPTAGVGASFRMIQLENGSSLRIGAGVTNEGNFAAGPAWTQTAGKNLSFTFSVLGTNAGSRDVLPGAAMHLEFGQDKRWKTSLNLGGTIGGFGGTFGPEKNMPVQFQENLDRVMSSSIKDNDLAQKAATLSREELQRLVAGNEITIAQIESVPVINSYLVEMRSNGASTEDLNQAARLMFLAHAADLQNVAVEQTKTSGIRGGGIAAGTFGIGPFLTFAITRTKFSTSLRGTPIEFQQKAFLEALRNMQNCPGIATGGTRTISSMNFSFRSGDMRLCSDGVYRMGAGSTEMSSRPGSYSMVATAGFEGRALHDAGLRVSEYDPATGRFLMITEGYDAKTRVVVVSAGGAKVMPSGTGGFIADLPGDNADLKVYRIALTFPSPDEGQTRGVLMIVSDRELTELPKDLSSVLEFRGSGGSVGSLASVEVTDARTAERNTALEQQIRNAFTVSTVNQNAPDALDIVANELFGTSENCPPNEITTQMRKFMRATANEKDGTASALAFIKTHLSKGQMGSMRSEDLNDLAHRLLHRTFANIRYNEKGELRSDEQIEQIIATGRLNGPDVIKSISGYSGMSNSGAAEMNGTITRKFSADMAANSGSFDQTVAKSSYGVPQGSAFVSEVARGGSKGMREGLVTEDGVKMVGAVKLDQKSEQFSKLFKRMQKPEMIAVKLAPAIAGALDLSDIKGLIDQRENHPIMRELLPQVEQAIARGDEKMPVTVKGKQIELNLKASVVVGVNAGEKADECGNWSAASNLEIRATGQVLEHHSKPASVTIGEGFEHLPGNVTYQEKISRLLTLGFALRAEQEKIGKENVHGPRSPEAPDKPQGPATPPDLAPPPVNPVDGQNPGDTAPPSQNPQNPPQGPRDSVEPPF